MYNKSKFMTHPVHFTQLLDGIFGNETDFNYYNKPSRKASVNIKETSEQYEVQVVAPGLKKEDFKIEVDKNVLTVSFEHQEEAKESTDKWLRQEFKMQSFSRSFTLTDSIDTEAIGATYDNGILSVRLPKKEKEAPKTVSISVQ